MKRSVRVSQKIILIFYVSVCAFPFSVSQNIKDPDKMKACFMSFGGSLSYDCGETKFKVSNFCVTWYMDL
jgi:hypothetical protein